MCERRPAPDEPAFAADCFALFGLPRRFRIDLAALDEAFRALQARAHPDRFARAGETERRVSLQWATRINEAYQRLKNPLSRAQHLLELLGAPEAGERSLPPEFLMEQMEWREAVAEASAAGALADLEALRARVRQKTKVHHDALAEYLDDRREAAPASDCLRRSMFLEKLRAEIDDALAALDEGGDSTRIVH